MVLTSAVREYILRMLSDVPGMKTLVLDKETLAIVSLVLSQSEMLHRDVVLVERVDSRTTEAMAHLKAVCFLRPSQDNMSYFKRHLKAPKFGEYHLYFSNIIPSSYLHMLADADTHEVIRQVQEYYGDYYAMDAFHFTLHAPDHHFAYVSATVDLNHTQRMCDRSVEALVAVFLSLKKRPVVRFRRGSEMAKRIAQETSRMMYEQEKPLFDFRRTETAPLLLVMDRRDDPVTPLLTQWTYQAMVHELIGIENNRVDLRHVAGVADDQKEVVLSADQDEFFKKNMFENFGDVGSSIARMVDELQKRDRRNKGIQSLDDMAKVLETYPEYRKQAGNVAKHVTIMSELQRVVERRKAMQVSEIEQELACSSAQATAYEAVMAMLLTDGIAEEDRLRLVMLYALRYEKESPRMLQQLMAKLTASPFSTWKPSMVYTLLRECGEERRVGDLFGNKDLLNLVARNMKRGLTGVENVYTQHQPLLSQIVDNAAKGRLKEVEYPFVGNHFQQQGSKPQELVIFIVGGSTYEEARTVALYNAANTGVKVILGGTSILNSKSFFSDLLELHHLESSVGLD